MMKRLIPLPAGVLVENETLSFSNGLPSLLSGLSLTEVLTPASAEHNYNSILLEFDSDPDYALTIEHHARRMMSCDQSSMIFQCSKARSSDPEAREEGVLGPEHHRNKEMVHECDQIIREESWKNYAAFEFKYATQSQV